MTCVGARFQRSRSQGDRRRTYMHLVPEAVTGLGPVPVRRVPRVVFICSGNSARSPLAAALWQGRSDVPAASAGTHPAERIHPRAIAAARRHGIALRHARPVHFDRLIGEDDFIVAVCDRVHEELPGGTTRVHWSVPDPARVDTDAAFDRALDDLADRIDWLRPNIHPAGTA